MEKELIFLEPVLKETIWGGDRIKKDFGIQKATDSTGESWCISAHENGDCIVKNGMYKGKTLSYLWKNHKELFGNVGGDKFPLLVKIIDAKDDLSIQVHPDDEYANKNENGSLGKKECWYILDCDENATIVIGHNAKTKDELISMINNKQWSEFIREIPVKKGDFFQINPGTVHAIKGGTLILETQQNSDITYRVYDYDRMCNGKLRELHLDKSIDVIQAPFEEKRIQCKNEEMLISCDKYTVFKIDVNSERILETSDVFKCVTVVEGEGMVNEIPVRKGESFIIPSNYIICLKGNMQLIVSEL